jgi:hypothetical protein
MSINHGSKVNGHNNGSICPSGKKAFASKGEAECWEVENRQKYPESAKQFAYACNECRSWHLTSMQPDAFGMAKSRQQIAPEAMLRNGNATPSRKPKQRYPESLKLEAFRLRDSGLSYKEIAARLDVAYFNLKPWFSNSELIAKYEKTKVPKTVEEFNSEEKRLEKQLDEIRAKKQATIEAKRLKLSPCWDGKGVLIKKEGNQFALLLADAEDLVLQLGDYLDRPEIRNQATAQASGM